MDPAPRYPYVAVDVAVDDAEAASERLFELGAQGLEERDGVTLVRAPKDRITLVASFEDDPTARAALGELPAGWSPRLEEVVGDAWRDEWKTHFEPFRVCGGVIVRPPWRAYDPRDGERVIELEPGRAFGTGLHETTSLVAEVLAAHAAEVLGATVLDVGAGSGILSLVALVLGARSAVAIDVDPDAVLVTRENAARNGMSDRVEASTAPLESVRVAFPLVLANIEARTLVDLAPSLIPRVADGGLLVLSGILGPHVAATQQDDVARAYGSLDLVAVETKGEWIAIVLRAGSRGSTSGRRP
jgi:ribosomal protein L11 methyltransferase